jgi:hypothetical protein
MKRREFFILLGEVAMAWCGLSVDAVRVSAPADLDAAFAEISRQPPARSSC